MSNTILHFDLASVLPWERDLEVIPASDGLPTVSIVIPIFNSGAFLEKTLRSLLCNDLKGVELILMDGGSSDNTMAIVEHYEEMFTVIHSAPDEGQSDAINRGFQKATGDILYWLNGDDIILPNTLNRIRERFRDNPDFKVLVGNAYMTEMDFSPIRHFVFAPEMLTFSYLLDYAKNHLIQPSVFFTREAWDEAGPLDVNDHYAMDADLFLGMVSKYSFEHIDLDVAYSVYHEDCKTRGARAESITSLALAQAKHGGLSEARNTLDILVDMYKQAEKTVAWDTRGSRAALQARLDEMMSLAEAQKELLLKIDLEEPR